MYQEVEFKDKARQRARRGASTIADAVRVTMGNKGRAVIIGKGGTPVFTLDGVTVARSIARLLDPVEDYGAQLIKNVAGTTNDECGDGTTTASVLAHALMTEGLSAIDKGIDPTILNRAFTEATAHVVEILREDSELIMNKEQMKSIATISSRDEEIGGVISEIYDKIGKDGVITTEEVKQIGIDYEVVEGLQIDNGWMTPHFITNPDRQVAELEKPKILVTSQSIRNISDVGPIMNEMLATDSRSLVIIADNVQGEALATVIVNKLKGVMNTLVIKAPGFGDNKAEHMRDICAITGATHITEEVGKRVEETTLEDLGEADRVIAHKTRTIIVGGKGKQEDIDERIAVIQNNIEDAESTYKKQNLETRLAKIKGGVAVIRVGDVTEDASREKQYRIEDAINSTKSAIEEGVVEGGGMALYKASINLDKYVISNQQDPKYKYCLEIVSKALKLPAYQILKNSGKSDNEIEDILRLRTEGLNKFELFVSNLRGSLGFDQDASALNAALPYDVIDPLKVERVALEQASSVMGLFLNSEAVVYDVDETKQSQFSKLVK